MTTAAAQNENQGLPLMIVIFGALATAVTLIGILAYVFWGQPDAAPAAPTWASQVLTVTDNPATEAIESGHSVRSVLYLEDVRAGDVAFAVNNLLGSPSLRANDAGNVLLLIVTGQTEQAARSEAQRWIAAVNDLLIRWAP